MTKKKDNPKPRGGSRPGAGRKLGVKLTDTVPVMLKLRPSTNDTLSKLAKSRKKTKSAVVEEALAMLIPT